MVLSPKAVSAIAGRAVERAVVPAVDGIFAPGEGRADASGRQRCERPPMAVRPPPQAERPKSPARGCAIAFEFIGADAPAAEHDWQRPRSGEQDAKGPAAWPGSNADQRKNPPAHGREVPIAVANYRKSSNPACPFTPECSISLRAMPCRGR